MIKWGKRKKIFLGKKRFFFLFVDINPGLVVSIRLVNVFYSRDSTYLWNTKRPKIPIFGWGKQQQYKYFVILSVLVFFINIKEKVGSHRERERDDLQYCM
jgi:hypothetical protein